MDVPISPCVCPGSPHPDGDTITLRDELDFRTAARMRNAVALLDDEERTDAALVLTVLQEQYLLHGVARWTLQDAQGAPIPVSVASVSTWLLPRALQASVVADAADDMYSDSVDGPFAGPGCDILAQYADGRIDISDDWLAARGDGAADAAEAILDYHYPDGRHRGSNRIARWRLQLLAELGLGWQLRQAQADEDAKVTRLRQGARRGRS